MGAGDRMVPYFGLFGTIKTLVPPPMGKWVLDLSFTYYRVWLYPKEENEKRLARLRTLREQNCIVLYKRY
jgi:hypothetical protein